MNGHPNPEALRRLILGSETEPVDSDVVRHLLRGCAQCRAIAARHWLTLEGGFRAFRDRTADIEEARAASTTVYDSALGRAFASARREFSQLTDARRSAPALIVELERHPHPRRVTLVRNLARFQTWGLCELLLERSYGARFSDPQAGLELAELAGVIGDTLDAQRYGRALLSDLRGRIDSYLGNARRVTSDLRGARRAFESADKYLRQGTGDQMDRALLTRFRAQLALDLGRFAEAHKLFDQAIAIYRESGDPLLLGRGLLAKGRTYLNSGDPAAALPFLEQASAVLEAEVEPQLALAARHNLVLSMIELGRAEEAQVLLTATRPLYRLQGDPMNLLRLRWLEAKIAERRARFNEAERALVEVREGFLASGIGYDAALASLELAVLYLKQGRAAEVKSLAQEMLTIFQSRDVHREAVAALIVFQRAAELETASVALVKEIATYLDQARHKPERRFRPADQAH